MKNKKLALTTTVLASIALFATGCSSTPETKDTSKNKSDVIKVAFYPDESTSNYDKARDEMKKILEEATDKKVKIVTSTNYNTVVESIANNQVDLAFMGGEGYLDANKINGSVVPIMTKSGPSGTTKDAVYYSYIAVPEEQTATYKQGNKYRLEPLKDKTFSFVSIRSTSGFQIPAKTIEKKFNLADTDELVIDDVFFSKVVFNNSHQDSAAAVLKGDVDAAAFRDMEAYFNIVEGEKNKAGMVYEVKSDADKPFDTVRGEKVRIIQAKPVLNGPLVANRNKLSDEDIERIKEKLATKAVSGNKLIFGSKEDNDFALYHKEGDEQFIEIDGSFYNALRE